MLPLPASILPTREPLHQPASAEDRIPSPPPDLQAPAPPPRELAEPTAHQLLAFLYPLVHSKWLRGHRKGVSEADGGGTCWAERVWRCLDGPALDIDAATPPTLPTLTPDGRTAVLEGACFREARVDKGSIDLFDALNGLAHKATVQLPRCFCSADVGDTSWGKVEAARCYRWLVTGPGSVAFAAEALQLITGGALGQHFSSCTPWPDAGALEGCDDKEGF